MMSIFRKAEVDPASITVQGAALDQLTHELEQDLIKQLSTFPETVARAAQAHAPNIICEYLESTAAMVNSWYHAGNPSRNPELAVLSANQELRNARLVLAKAIQIVLNNGLSLLGLNAPDRMDRDSVESNGEES
jgi:arginyl-tRNA synthetase